MLRGALTAAAVAAARPVMALQTPACRLRYEPERRSDHIGFRVVVTEL